MLKYLLRRILLFIPTLIIISLIAFVISVSAPGDPVATMLTVAESDELYSGKSDVHRQQVQFWKHRLGLDLPVFYVSVTPLSFPDTLYKIYDEKEREAFKSFLYQNGNRERIQQYRIALLKLESVSGKLNLTEEDATMYPADKISIAYNETQYLLRTLMTSSDHRSIESKLNELEKWYSDYDFLSRHNELLSEVRQSYESMRSHPLRWKNLVPTLHFYGNNQYHRWLFGDGHWLTGKGSTYSKGLIRGDFGISFLNGRPIGRVIWERIGWSLLLTLISVVLAYLISLPVGIRAATHHGSLFDRGTSVFLFLLHSMPAFWVATLLLITFANPDLFPWFPASGVKPVTGYPVDASFFEKIKITLPYLILPIIAYTYSSLAFLSRLTRVTMLEVIHQDYIKTARAKGLSEKKVIYLHGLRNALLPIITVFANILPAAIGGSVILESIFTIPGMGLETYNAIHTQDYPMIVGVFTLTGILTLIGYLLADIFYAWADPRISFSKS